MGGPASGTTTLRGLNFDITYDPAKVTFVAATSYASPLFPSPPALVAVALYNNLQGRVIVSLQQPSGSSDVTVLSGQHRVLSLSFGRVSGATFPPTPLQFENAEATAASQTIGFSSGLALSYQ